MTYIYSIIHIDRPIEDVFDYVTTPAKWPRWHPSSLSVTGEAGHSLTPGQQVIEAFRVAGRRGRVVWTVREREAPHRWVIDGQIEGSRSSGTVLYTLTARPDGTTFEREFIYKIPNPLLRILDWFSLRRRIEAESAEALRRLKRVLETGEAARASDGQRQFNEQISPSS